MVPLTTFEEARVSMPSESRHISSRLAFLFPFMLILTVFDLQQQEWELWYVRKHQALLLVREEIAAQGMPYAARAVNGGYVGHFDREWRQRVCSREFWCLHSPSLELAGAPFWVMQLGGRPEIRYLSVH